MLAVLLLYYNTHTKLLYLFYLRVSFRRSVLANPGANAHVRAFGLPEPKGKRWFWSARQKAKGKFPVRLHDCRTVVNLVARAKHEAHENMKI